MLATAWVFGLEIQMAMGQWVKVAFNFASKYLTITTNYLYSSWLKFMENLWNIIAHRIRMYAMIMACHWPSIYPIHVSILFPYDWIRHGSVSIFCPKDPTPRASSHLVADVLRGSQPSWVAAAYSQKRGSPGRLKILKRPPSGPLALDSIAAIRKPSQSIAILPCRSPIKSVDQRISIPAP